MTSSLSALSPSLSPDSDMGVKSSWMGEWIVSRLHGHLKVGEKHFWGRGDGPNAMMMTKNSPKGGAGNAVGDDVWCRKLGRNHHCGAGRVARGARRQAVFCVENRDWQTA